MNNTARWEKKGGRHFFSQIEPNFPLPYCTVLEGCQAGGLGHLFRLQYMREYNAESNNTAKSSTLNKMKHFAHLCNVYIGNLSMPYTVSILKCCK